MFNTVGNGTSLKWLNSSAIFDRENVGNTTVTEKLRVFTSEASDSDSIISNEDYKIAARVIECGIIPALGFLGLPANILNMVVFYRQGLRDKMNLCLFALAFVDFMSVFSMFTYTLHCTAAAFTDTLLVQILRWNTLKFTLNFRNAFLYSSGTFTAIIAIERCICVVFPLKSANVMKTKTMAWMMFGIIVFFNVLCLLHPLKQNVNLETDDAGKVIVVFKNTDLFLNHLKLAFQIIRDGILPSISFITFFIVSFVTVVTVRKLKTAMDWRQKTSSHVIDKRQMTLVKILITVSSVYIACSVPKLSLFVVRLLLDGFSTNGKYNNLFFITHEAGFGFMMVNSSVNIFIYYIQSSRFRKELHACACYYKEETE